MRRQLPIGPERIPEDVNVTDQHLLTKDPVHSVPDLSRGTQIDHKGLGLEITPHSFVRGGEAHHFTAMGLVNLVNLNLVNLHLKAGLY